MPMFSYRQCYSCSPLEMPKCPCFCRHNDHSLLIILPPPPCFLDRVCWREDDRARIMLCGDGKGHGCNGEFHSYCVDPPLLEIPEDDWFCPSCTHKESQQSSMQTSCSLQSPAFQHHHSHSRAVNGAAPANVGALIAAVALVPAAGAGVLDLVPGLTMGSRTPEDVPAGPEILVRTGSRPGLQDVGTLLQLAQLLGMVEHTVAAGSVRASSGSETGST